jgi:zinc transport system substrate-binding protein
MIILFKWIAALSVSFLLTQCDQVKQVPRPQIIVSIPSYERLLQEAVGERFEVICVVPEGFNAHFFEVRPKDLDKIRHPVAWFGVHEGFEAKLLETLKARFSHLKYYDLIDAIPEAEWIQECHCHHHHDGHEHHHDHNLVDNHLWMSPRLMIQQMSFIQQQLASNFQENLEGFSQVQDQLKRLDESHRIQLAPYRGQAILASHGSFAYFCREYGLKQLTIELEGKQPMPQDLEKLMDKLQREKIICVFAQVQFDQQGANLIAKKIGKPLYTIDPYTKDYIAMQKDLVKKITAAHDSN